MKYPLFQKRNIFPKIFTKTDFRCWIFSVVFLLMSAFLNAHATFLVSDANEVDREYYDFEYFVDQQSYRYSLGLQEVLLNGDIAYVTSFGSLDGYHFYRKEDTKISKDVAKFNLSYSRSVQENLVEKTEQQDFSVAYFLQPALSLFFSTESDFFKKWMDFGLGLRLFDLDGATKRQIFGFKLIAVDALYNVKEQNSQNYYQKSIWTVQIEKSFWLAERDFITAHVELDSPLVWHRNSQGYVYRYKREIGGILFERKLTDSLFLLGGSRYEHKSESKEFVNFHKNANANDQRNAKLSMERQALESTMELRINPANVGRTNRFIVSHLARRTSYLIWGRDIALAQVEPSQSRKPMSGNWNQITLSQLNIYQLYETKHFVELGASVALIQNRVIDESKLNGRSNQGKIHTGWEYRFENSGVFGFNVSWDLDNWVRKALYNQDYPSSWDGGNFQLAVSL